MDRIELKNWAKKKIEGHIWELLIPIIIVGAIAGFKIGPVNLFKSGKIKYTISFPIGMFLYFISVGFAYFMINFVNDKKHNLKDLLHFADDYVRDFITDFWQSLYCFLWALLFIIPGVMKAYAYSMVPILLADDKYKKLDSKEILQKSEEIMYGHKMDLFVLDLSFIGWHFLAIFTLGLLEIWIIPYQTTARYKFLDNLR
ncbi:MAG: DUF975 family protein [Bacilli bacterium]|nr:DUF975 family protein [Bacilli bacterium]